jgi:arylsulfatase A-like enzyme
LPSDILPENFNLRSLVALYYDAVAWVDELLGNIVNTVQENGLADNTMLVFVSDHGDNLGSHHLFNKDCLFEESIRIPLIMQWMGQIAPRVNHEHIAQIIDIAPTILAMCGVEPPATMQGRDLSEIVSGDTVVLPDNWAFIEIDPSQFGKPGIGIRTPRYLYGMSLKNDERTIDNDEAWFYDLQIDHLQQNNLAGVAEYDEIRGLLKSRLQKWHLETMWLSVDS